MLAFVKTWMDVIALRKGPDATPASWVSVAIAALLYAVGLFVQLTLYDIPDGLLGSALLGYGLALGVYALVCVAHGFSARLLQMLATVVACGSLLMLCSAAVALVVIPFGGVRAATIAAQLVLYWSIPVEGHIVARTVEKSWMFGIVVAVFVFLISYAIQSNGLESAATGTA